MSRFCMYCGRELEKSEQCNCSASVAARMKRDGASNTENSRKADNTAHQNTSYNSGQWTNAGNVKAEKVKKEKAQKEKIKKERPKKAKRGQSFGGNQYGSGNFFRNFGVLIKEFMKNPVYTITNPGAAGKGEAIAITGLLGIVVSLVVFFSTSNISRNILSMASRIIGFKGTQGFAEIGNMLLNMLTFTAFSYIQFFILAGIFYLIQKFVLRMYTSFWDIALRVAISYIPVAVVGIIGIVIGFFSMQTVIMLVLAAVLVSVVLMYEALRSMWQTLLSDRLVYIMATGYFVYFSLCVNLFVALLKA